MVETLADFLIGCYLARLDQWFWAAIVMLPPVGLIARQLAIGPALIVLTVGTFIFKAVLPGGPFNFFLWFVITALVTWVGYKIFVEGKGLR